jgi:hypothetical protein
MLSDWTAYFWPQITAPWSLHIGIFNLPWLFVVLQVIRPLGKDGAWIVLAVGSLFVTVRVARSLGLSAWQQALVLLSPPVVWGFFMGQFDGLFLAAYLTPPALSMFLVLSKLQVSIGAGLVAIRRDWRTAILALVLILSAWWIWGWPFECENPETGGPFSDSPAWNWAYGIWPWSFLLLPLLRTRRGRLFLSPFLFPYAGVQSLIGPMLVAATWPWWTFVGIWLASWLKWAYMVRLIG